MDLESSPPFNLCQGGFPESRISTTSPRCPHASLPRLLRHLHHLLAGRREDRLARLRDQGRSWGQLPGAPALRKFGELAPGERAVFAGAEDNAGRPVASESWRGLESR